MRAGPNRAASWANLKGSSRSRFDFPNNQHGALVGPSSFVDEVPEDAQVRRVLSRSVMDGLAEPVAKC